jgi:hypothetical protein
MTKKKKKKAKKTAKRSGPVKQDKKSVRLPPSEYGREREQAMADSQPEAIANRRSAAKRKKK